jgi:hypothetical protein
MEWSQEIVMGLIELYKRKQIIWDPKHPMHFNKIRKQYAEEEMRKKMNRPVKKKKKMENLLSSFRREKMKMRKSSGTGKGEYF